MLKPQLPTDNHSLGAQGFSAGTLWNSPWMHVDSVTVTGAGDQPNWSEPTAAAAAAAAAAKVERGRRWLAAGWLVVSLKTQLGV